MIVTQIRKYKSFVLYSSIVQMDTILALNDLLGVYMPLSK